MKKIKLVFLLFLIFPLITSCGSFSDVKKTLRNEKTISTDEFLVKKRKPLIMPPDINKIPEPTQNDATELEGEGKKLENILKTSKIKNTNKNKSSTIEKSILDKIKK